MEWATIIQITFKYYKNVIFFYYHKYKGHAYDNFEKIILFREPSH